MINHEEKAHELFKQGYNCAQSVFAAFCDVTGIDFETAIKLTSGFGAGMGGMRDTCGAVTGMFMVADMLYGYTDSQATTEKAAHYATIRKLAEQFKEENQSLMCRDLLAFCKKAQQPMERTDAYYAERPCTRLVMDAARLLVYRAAQAKQDGEAYSHLAAMAKLFASDVANQVTRECVQLVGGYGYSREYPFERMMRDAKITEIYEGTSEVQRMVISSHLGVK